MNHADSSERVENSLLIFGWCVWIAAVFLNTFDVIAALDSIESIPSIKWTSIVSRGFDHFSLHVRN